MKLGVGFVGSRGRLLLRAFLLLNTALWGEFLWRCVELRGWSLDGIEECGMSIDLSEDLRYSNSLMVTPLLVFCALLVIAARSRRAPAPLSWPLLTVVLLSGAYVFLFTPIRPIHLFPDINPLLWAHWGALVCILALWPGRVTAKRAG